MPKVIDVVAAIGAALRRRLLWVLAVAALVLGLAGFLWWRAASRRPQYVTATVTLGNIQRNISTTGALNPVVTVQVGSYVSGTIKSLGCDFNTEVVVGQTCARIDPVPFQLIVDQDRAQVATAAAQLKKDKAAQVYAKIAFERDSKLLAEGTVSQDAVDNDRSVYDQSLAQVGLDEASVVDKQAALKAAEVNLAYTNIVSPVVGTVITRSIDVGQTVAASLQTPTLFLIGKDLTKMQVDTNVSEADVGDLRVGQEAYFTVQAFPGRSFHGKVWQIRRGPITVQNVVTYDVVVAFANPQRLLFPGMTADTHIVTDEHDNVLRVPLPAIRFTPEGLGRAAGGRGRGAGAAEGAGGAASAGGAVGAGGAESGLGSAASGAGSATSAGGAGGAANGGGGAGSGAGGPTSGAGGAASGPGGAASAGGAGGAANGGGGAESGAGGAASGPGGAASAGGATSGAGGANPPGAPPAAVAGAEGPAAGQGGANGGEAPREARHGAWRRHGESAPGQGADQERRPGQGEHGAGERERGEGRGERGEQGPGARGPAAGAEAGAEPGAARGEGDHGGGAAAEHRHGGQGEGRQGERGARGAAGDRGDRGERSQERRRQDAQGRAAGAAGRRAARVWVMNADGTLRPVQVTTGLDDGTLIEISGPGLRPGDRVVVNEIVSEDRRRAGNGPGPGQGQGLRPPGAGGPGGGFGQGGPRL